MRLRSLGWRGIGASIVTGLFPKWPQASAAERRSTRPCSIMAPRRPCGGAQWPAARADALVGDEAGRDRARHGELIGEKAVEALGLGGDDAERDGGRRHGCSTALASLARSCARPSSQRETASAIAPT